MKEFIESIAFFNQACENKDVEGDVKLIRKEINVNYDIPLQLWGLLKELCSEKPQYYWKRDVADEVSNILDDLFLKNNALFKDGFQISSIEFFESIRAFENITKIISEIRNVAFEESFKTRIFRNPVFSQICEDFLMNIYRVLRNVINQYSEKDYSNQNTLTPIIQCLNKNGFSKATDLNINLRNAVNHGNVFVDGNRINYRYGKPSSYEYEVINFGEYDDIIDETYDMACGILVGVLRVLSKYPNIIRFHFVLSEENALGWFRLMYKNEKFKILDLTKGEINSSQLNINIDTCIEDKTNLLLALIEVAKGAFMLFPGYDRYFVGYNHNRSSSGFIRVTNSELSQTFNVPELCKTIVNSNDMVMLEIMNTDINVNAYKYHVFPKIKCKEYEVLDIQDCSIRDFKRIKAKIILSERMNKRKIKTIISSLISKLSSFETPQNPYENTAWGPRIADAVFVDVFIDNPNRKKFNLFPENNSFVSMVHYYRDESCPKIKNGGVMEELWNLYKKEKINNNILIAWNPSYEFK